MIGCVKFTRSIDVVIRSYYRDFRWLALALRSLERFVSGYRRVVVVVPQASLARSDVAVLGSGANVVVQSCGDFADDYVGQQVTKLHADLYTDADIIFHLDSDQIYRRALRINPAGFWELIEPVNSIAGATLDTGGWLALTLRGGVRPPRASI